jgi:tRNA(Ile)-lysidine synthase
MPAARSLGAGRLMRPLLELPRETLAGYARSHRLSWIEDPSNADLSLDRNFLRRRLLPELQERFDGLSMRLSRVAGNIADAGTALDELAGLDRHPLPLEVFDGLSQPARIALLRRWLTGREVTAGVTRVALAEFLRQLDAGNDRRPALDLPTGRLVRYRRALHLVGPAPELEASYPLSVPGQLSLPHGTLTLRPLEAEQAGAECIRLQGPVFVTFLDELEPGIRVRQGPHHRSIRTLMREAGVPPWLRESLPIVCDGQGPALIPGVVRRDRDTAGEAPASAATLTEVRWSGEVR